MDFHHSARRSCISNSFPVGQIKFPVRNSARLAKPDIEAFVADLDITSDFRMRILARGDFPVLKKCWRVRSKPPNAKKVANCFGERALRSNSSLFLPPPVFRIAISTARTFAPNFSRRDCLPRCSSFLHSRMRDL